MDDKKLESITPTRVVALENQTPKKKVGQSPCKLCKQKVNNW